MTTSPVADDLIFLGGYEADERLAGLVGDGGPFAVTVIEIDGVPVRTYGSAPGTLIDLFGVAHAHDEKDALVFEGERLTFGELRNRAAVLARHLREDFGVEPGDRVAVVMRNFPEFVITLWASVLSGAVLVPLNSWWTGPEIDAALKQAEAKLVVADAERVALLTAAGHDSSSIPVIGVRPEGTEHTGDHAFTDLIVGEPLSPEEYATPAPDDVFAILFTSGTTGTPKGVMTTHRGTITNVMNMMFMPVRDMMLSGRMPTTPAKQPAGVLTTPLFHIGGLAAAVGAAITGGKTVLTRKWDVEETMRIVEEEGVTGMGGAPAIARAMLEHPRLPEFASQLTAFTIGAASVPPELPRLAADILGEDSTQVFNGYGATETTSQVAMNVGGEYLTHLDSVGRLNPTAELRVEAADGSFVGVGEIGQLCFRSPQVARGYWNNPEATAESFVDGWFRTGDVGYIDDDGFIYVVDRVKDVIIRGGENVYCAEVEAVLFEHPDVLDVAAVGVPDEIMGERVCAVVVPRPGATPTLTRLREFAAGRLAGFKLPEALHITEDVPRTATGKIAKKKLKDSVVGNRGALVWE